MFPRLVKVLKLALAPIESWTSRWQMLVSALLLVAPGLASIFNRLSLRVAVELSLGTAFCAAVLAMYRLQKQYDHALDSVPRLVATIGSREATIHSNSKPIGRPRFYHLRIANAPTGTLDRKTAERVAGRVQILNAKREAIAPERLHRWADAPSVLEVGKLADHMQGIDIAPNLIEYPLDLVLKYDEDDHFYTHNNDTSVSRWRDFRDPEFKFGPGTYIARARIAGINIVAEFECEIQNEGKGEKLKLRIIKQP